MDLFRNPHNKGAIKQPSVSVVKRNPMCGDEITLQLDIVDGVVKKAKFDGSACSVSVISASVLTDFLIGKKLAEVKKLEKDDLLKMINLNLTTSRVACATLVLSALKESIKKYEEGRSKNK